MIPHAIINILAAHCRLLSLSLVEDGMDISKRKPILWQNPRNIQPIVAHVHSQNQNVLKKPCYFHVFCICPEKNEDIFPAPSFGVRQVVCQRSGGDSLSARRKLIRRVLEENGQDSWLASRDIDLPQPPKQSLTCFPCPYFILCSLMLVLFDFSFISTDLSFDTLLGVHKHWVVPGHWDLRSPAACETTLSHLARISEDKITLRCLYN